MTRRALAGRSGSFTAESDSMSSHNACRASPVGADEKSSLNWISRLSLSRLMSYLPLFSFGPSASGSPTDIAADFALVHTPEELAHAIAAGFTGALVIDGEQDHAELEPA